MHKVCGALPGREHLYDVDPPATALAGVRWGLFKCRPVGASGPPFTACHCRRAPPVVAAVPRLSLPPCHFSHCRRAPPVIAAVPMFTVYYCFNSFVSSKLSIMLTFCSFSSGPRPLGWGPNLHDFLSLSSRFNDIHSPLQLWTIKVITYYQI